MVDGPEMVVAKAQHRGKDLNPVSPIEEMTKVNLGGLDPYIAQQMIRKLQDNIGHRIKLMVGKQLKVGVIKEVDDRYYILWLIEYDAVTNEYLDTCIRLGRVSTYSIYRKKVQ